MTTEAETQIQTPGVERKPDNRWQDRRSVQLTISRALYRKLKLRARAEGMPFATWLTHLALRELRKPL